MSRSIVKDIARAALSIVPVQYRASLTYSRVKRFLAAAQWWDAASIERWQLARLRRTVEYAWNHVPGYRALYEQERIRPEDVRSLTDIRALPFVTKALIGDNVEDFTSRAIPRFRLRYVATSGSTGTPFGFFQTDENTRIERAFMHAGWERSGWKRGPVAAVLRGTFVGSESEHWVYRRFERELLLSSYFLSDASYPAYDEVLARYAPRYLQAYPSALATLSDLVSRFGKRFPDFEVLLLGSENLYDWQRVAFARAFPKSRIFSWYGHSEQTILAPACERSDRLHVWPFYGLAELLDDAGNEVREGESGELVGTSFWSRGTPFIRYRTQDMAVRGSAMCTHCGRAFQLLDRIDGRRQEMIVTGRGRLVSMTALVGAMHGDVFDVLAQLQFYQEEPGRVVLRCVPRTELSSGELERIRKELQPKLGSDMELSLVTVTEIPRTRSGKVRLLEQKLTGPRLHA